ncbi:MAG: hypothetical protein M3T49_07075 [Candidatus Eremiobacteraeota bacterium]|nr:hypothetical protein [Candidatus Eremiobacteraeota bacterium]
MQSKGRQTTAPTSVNVAVVRGPAGRGLSALHIIDPAGASADHYVPFRVREVPASLGRDYAYAGLGAALDLLRALKTRNAVIATTEAAVVAEVNMQAEPLPGLTLAYITLGCKLNRLAESRLIAVPPQRLEPLRIKALARIPASWAAGRGLGRTCVSMPLVGLV